LRGNDDDNGIQLENWLQNLGIFGIFGIFGILGIFGIGHGPKPAFRKQNLGTLRHHKDKSDEMKN
jgi:hypothetical protein